ncbi:Pituitary-specific positive transcription factor 1 [Orchesella cincta]|uniref:Pituitary-specific positive transcription factor 1 n=1 Tax=Orchesella cincta TaxID=48709 RepID=A0A1D2NI01_ORCCI|nr:Pituitary-specific positive transcription factor 1 [Orchesella cincta]
MTSLRQRNDVTLLHKGLGPGLFQYRSQPLPIYDENLNSPRSSIRSGNSRPAKKTIVKCLDRQDANSMFAKRIRERSQPQPQYITTSRKTYTSRKTQQRHRKSEAEEACDLLSKEQMFTNVAHKTSAFPPPTFMPRWNPRHRDRTYCQKRIFLDPWSLSAPDRDDLQKRTGLRLKSLSRHYQFKVGSNLPFGKEAMEKSNCLIEYCDHCNKSHFQRCPLHFNLMDPVEADCKTELGRSCPESKNPEDMNLEEINDVITYVSETERRLKAGEITETPPFPRKFLDAAFDKKPSHIVNAEESESTLNAGRRVELEDTISQTEPFRMDLDLKGFFKDNITQTVEPDSEDPKVLSLRPTIQTTFFQPFQSNDEKGTHVVQQMILGFEDAAKRVVAKVADMTMAQSLQELDDEERLRQLQKVRAMYTEQLANMHRAVSFSYMQEKFRISSYIVEEQNVQRETDEEVTGERYLGAALFAQSYLQEFTGKVMDSLRVERYIANEDLAAIQTVFIDGIGEDIANKLEVNINTNKVLDDMINHALMDLEVDYFRSYMIDEHQLETNLYTSRDLRDLIELKDDTIEMLLKIKERLIRLGWAFNADGELVRRSIVSEGSSSVGDLETFLNAVRVSLDGDGNPKYLVDLKGRPIPINANWLRRIYQQMTTNGELDPTRRFDIILGEGSLASDITEHETGAGGTTAVQEEFEGSDFTDNFELADDDEDEGRVIFHTSRSSYEFEDFEGI